MSKFIIKGNQRLEGEIGVLGSKNAAGPCLAACLLTDQECFVSNVPRIADVFTLLDIIKGLGAVVEWVGERTVKIKATHLDPSQIDLAKVARVRMSVLLIGALLGRFQEFKIGRPGGDRIGLRPITTHLKAFQALGVEVEETDGSYFFKRQESLQTGRVVLSEFSVTATENVLLASAVGKGAVVLKGAAVEPHIQDLRNMLSEMGAEIEWTGSHQFRIKGKKQLAGARHNIIPDYIEAGTFIVVAAATPGKVVVKGMRPQHLELFLLKMQEMGVEFERGEDWIRVFGSSAPLQPVRIQALPYPGFPTDLLPLVVPLLTRAQGRSLIHDPLYENRLNYVQELRKMKADIEIVDPHRAFVFGPTNLRGVRIESWDIRAGASLVVAGLMAEGNTWLCNIEQIDRGYERLDERLQALGADIKRREA